MPYIKQKACQEEPTGRIREGKAGANYQYKFLFPFNTDSYTRTRIKLAAQLPAPAGAFKGLLGGGRRRESAQNRVFLTQTPRKPRRTGQNDTGGTNSSIPGQNDPLGPIQRPKRTVITFPSREETRLRGEFAREAGRARPEKRGARGFAALKRALLASVLMRSRRRERARGL